MIMLLQFTLEKKKRLHNIYRIIDNTNYSPVLRCLLIRVEDGNVYFIGTDAFMLVEHKIAEVEDVPDDDILIPYHEIQNIRKLKGDLFFEYDGARVEVDGDDDFVIFSEEEGEYPDYRKNVLGWREPKTMESLSSEDYEDALEYYNNNKTKDTYMNMQDMQEFGEYEKHTFYYEDKPKYAIDLQYIKYLDYFGDEFAMSERIASSRYFEKDNMKIVIRTIQ